jgi:deoxyribonuclease-4
MSGIEYSDKGEQNHLPIEESDFVLSDLLRALNDFNCSGRILCESPVMEEDALMMKEAWEKLVGEESTEPENG